MKSRISSCVTKRRRTNVQNCARWSRAYHGRQRENIPEDPALEWARNNPEAARRCLHLPSIDPWTDVPATDVCSFEDYWSFRGWKWPQTNGTHARTLASHALSAPLTVASAFVRSSGRRRWCCVGARAEASLPVLYWREALLLMCKNETNDCVPYSRVNCDFSLDFIGPDIVRHPDVTLLFHRDWPFSLTLKWPRPPGLFHDVVTEQEMIDEYDGFVLLNPGIGHPSLSRGWSPTIETLVGSGKPLLLTAHSDLDARREENCWKQYYGVDVRYQVNPFRSRLQYIDPLEESHDHWVSPNFAVAFQTSFYCGGRPSTTATITPSCSKT